VRTSVGRQSAVRPTGPEREIRLVRRPRGPLVARHRGRGGL